jgi:hypothetical protein
MCVRACVHACVGVCEACDLVREQQVQRTARRGMRLLLADRGPRGSAAHVSNISIKRYLREAARCTHSVATVQ